MSNKLCTSDCGEIATLIVEMDFGDLPMCEGCEPVYKSNECYLKTRSI